jgi:hypothetical protein
MTNISTSYKANRTTTSRHNDADFMAHIGVSHKLWYSDKETFQQGLSIPHHDAIPRSAQQPSPLIREQRPTLENGLPLKAFLHNALVFPEPLRLARNLVDKLTPDVSPQGPRNDGR